MPRRFLHKHGPFVLLLLVLSPARLWLMTTLELNEDEAYYWEWSRNLALSYYDQGPGVAFAMALGTSLLGHTEFGVRLVSFLMGIVTLCLGYGLVWRVSRSPSAAVVAALLLAFVPINFISGLVMIHDSVMYFGWVGFVYGFCRYLETRHAGWLYACGFFLGIGMLAKHTMVLLVPPVFILAILRPEERALLRNPHFWLAAGLAACMALPIVIWNAQHDWAGLQAILHLPSANDHGRPFYQTLGDFLGGQLLVLNPFIAIPMAMVVWRALRFGRGDARAQFLALTTAFMFAFFFVMSLGKMVQANWPVCAYFGGLLLLGIDLGRRWEAGGRRLAWASIVSTVMMLVPVVFPSTLALPARALGLALHPGAIMTNRLYGGREIAEQLDLVRQQHPGIQVCGNRYQETALLAFYLPDHPRTFSLNVEARPNQYDFWQPPEAHLGKDFILVCLTHDEPPSTITNLFQSWEALPPGTVENYGTTAKKYRFFLMRGFLGREQPSTDGASHRGLRGGEVD
jgi:hypothetical protein